MEDETAGSISWPHLQVAQLAHYRFKLRQLDLAVAVEVQIVHKLEGRLRAHLKEEGPR